MADPEESAADRIKRLFQPRPGEDAAEQFIRVFKDLVRPDLINEVPDEFFEKGREMELNRRVMEVVDARMIRDKVPIGRGLRLRLIESILEDIERARRNKSGK